MNPYNKCVANKVINGEQCTIAWYVDDNIITHKDKGVLKDVFSKICDVFGKMELNVGDTHQFLGMTIKLHQDSKMIEVGMKGQLIEAIELFELQYGKLESRYTSPAGHHLFEINSDEVLLDIKKRTCFIRLQQNFYIL